MARVKIHGQVSLAQCTMLWGQESQPFDLIPVFNARFNVLTTALTLRSEKNEKLTVGSCERHR